MSVLEELCRQYTALSEADIGRLLAVEEHLPLMAELTNADVFLDCLINEETALVVSHMSPAEGISVYEKRVVGEYAEKAKEPAVFHAFQTGMPVCDLKAVTQENRSVRQNVVPIRNGEHRVIAVLIREKDISQDLRLHRKYEELARTHEENNPLTRMVDVGQENNLLALREMHHRVKNNLQLVASILNLQARKSAHSEVQRILKENVSRIMSIAAIHDILLKDTETLQTISGGALLDQLCCNLKALIPPDKAIVLSWSGDEIELTSDTATSVSLVITELVTNAIQHAFEGRFSGRVDISVCRGELYHTVAVKDDGIGFATDSGSGKHLGLSVVDATIRDKLKGKPHILSDSYGTQVSFEFRS